MSKKSTATRERELAQLMICRQLIANQSFHSQQQIRLALQQQGYPEISQSTVSRLLALLDVIKTVNARGERTYTLSPHFQSKPDAISPLSAMVLSVDYNEKFVIAHVVPGYARAIARVIEHAHLEDVLGIVATSNSIWIAPRNTLRTLQLQRAVLALVMPPTGSQTWHDSSTNREFAS